MAFSTLVPPHTWGKTNSESDPIQTLAKPIQTLSKIIYMILVKP